MFQRKDKNAEFRLTQNLSRGEAEFDQVFRQRNQLVVAAVSVMIFSVSNDGIQWTLDFGPGSVTTAVNDRDQNITISSQEKLLTAWQLLLSQRQDFLNNHLARVPITTNQEGTMEMSEEVLSSVGAQDLDTSSYQVSDLQRHRVQLGVFTVGHGFSIQTRHRHPLFSNSI